VELEPALQALDAERARQRAACAALLDACRNAGLEVPASVDLTQGDPDRHEAAVVRLVGLALHDVATDGAIRDVVARDLRGALAATP
jgi:hypothetical protein